MLDGLFENILAKGGWQEFIPILVIGAIVVLKFLGKLISDKAEDAGKQRPAQRPPSAQPRRPYAPLDEQGKVIKRPQPRPQRQPQPLRQAPAQRPIRRPDSVYGEPIAPAQAKIMPEHDHTLECAARKKYQQEQVAKKKRQAAQQQRIAQQIRQKAVARPKPTTRPAPELIEESEPITLENFTGQPQNLRTAFILSEVLGKPIAMRDSPSTRIY